MDNTQSLSYLLSLVTAQRLPKSLGKVEKMLGNLNITSAPVNEKADKRTIKESGVATPYC